MGTKNCPETPRQKMINMMYLVLTAMLALNVAAETLEAFKIVDSSLMQTYKSFKSKNDNVIINFENQYELNQNKVKKWLEKAHKTEELTDSIINVIKQTKVDLALQAGAEPVPEGEIRKEEFPYVVTLAGDTLVLEAQDDLNASPFLMVEKPNERGKFIQEQIKLYKQELISLLEPENRKSIEKKLNTAINVSDPSKPKGLTDDKSRTWAEKHFLHTPVIASITLLSKLQIDILNAESEVLNHLYGQIDAASFKFTNLSAEVITENTYLFEGQEMRGKIFLSATDSTQDLKVIPEGRTQPLEIGDDGKAVFSFVPPIGDGIYKGNIFYTPPGGGDPNTYAFEVPYKVVPPVATISATKMNVIFPNLDNPFSISVPGVDSDELEAQISKGSIVKDNNGGWIVRPNKEDIGTTILISVYAKIDGKKKEMAKQEFRVESVPYPEAQLGGKAQGYMAKELLVIQRGIAAELKDFYFDLTYEVVGFEVSVPGAGGTTKTESSRSNLFTSAQKQLINSLGVGDQLVVQNIKAKIQGEEDGEPIGPLSPIVLTIR